MPTKTEKEYATYLHNRPLALDLCFLVSTNGHLTATEAAETLKVSIGTANNGLRELEVNGLIVSRKSGRTRTYVPKDLATLQRALNHSIPVDRKGRSGERVFPLATFQKQLAGQLAQMKGVEIVESPRHQQVAMTSLTFHHAEGFVLSKSIEKDLDVAPLVNVNLDLVLRLNQDRVYYVLVSRIVDETTMLASLGRLVLLSSVPEVFESLITVNLYKWPLS